MASILKVMDKCSICNKPMVPDEDYDVRAYRLYGYHKYCNSKRRYEMKQNKT